MTALRVAPSVDLRQPAHPKPANFQKAPANILLTPANLCTAVHSLHPAAPTGQAIKPRPSNAQAPYSIAAQQDSAIRKLLDCLMIRDFLSKRVLTPPLLSNLPPPFFSLQNRCSTTFFARRLSVKGVDLQRLWRIPPDSGQICRRPATRGHDDRACQQTSKPHQQTRTANNGN